jgi:hypothetical protein
MAITLLGEMTLAAAIPLLGSAATALSAAVAAELPDLNGRIAAFTEAAVSIGINPPQAALLLEAAAAFTPPSVDANFALDAGAALELELGDLNIYAALALSIAGILATAGVSVYAGTAPSGTLGLPALIAGAPNPTVPVFCIVLACQASATPTVAALSTAFGVSA